METLVTISFYLTVISSASLYNRGDKLGIPDMTFNNKFIKFEQYINEKSVKKA